MSDRDLADASGRSVSAATGRSVSDFSGRSINDFSGRNGRSIGIESQLFPWTFPLWFSNGEIRELSDTA